MNAFQWNPATRVGSSVSICNIWWEIAGWFSFYSISRGLSGEQMQSNQQKMIDFPTKPLKCTIMNWSRKGRKKILLAISVVLIQYTDFLYQFNCEMSEKNRDIMILSIKHHLTFFVLFIRCFDLRFNWRLYRSLSERDIFLNFQQTSNNNYFLLNLELVTRFRRIIPSSWFSVWKSLQHWRNRLSWLNFRDKTREETISWEGNGVLHKT